MWFSRKQVTKSPQGQAGAGTGQNEMSQSTTKRRGDAAESLALAHLLKAGCKWVASNYRTPGRGGGEIDLIMRAPDGTLVFVEVRQRSGQSHGGAGASIGAVKQRRIIFAARHYLMRLSSPPPCRFDVVLVQGTLAEPQNMHIEWLCGAFDAS